MVDYVIWLISLMTMYMLIIMSRHIVLDPDNRTWSQQQLLLYPYQNFR